MEHFEKLLIKSKSQNTLSLIAEDESEISDPRLVAEQFNNYFADAVKCLSENSINDQPQIYENESEDENESDQSLERNPGLGNVFELPFITNQFVVNEIKKLGLKKATGPDDISCRLFKVVADLPFLLDSLTYIYNLSLSSGIVPEAWKIARIQPIHKSGNKNAVENYRPISLLCIPSKILEKAVHKHLYDFLISNQKLCDNQFGFRPGLSCETALLSLIDVLAHNVDEGRVNGIAFVDLRKAFDSVDHEVLLRKLSLCGCSEHSVQWFRSYLNERSQFVSVKGVSSHNREVSTGVPQGSVLGPLLFIIVMNDLPASISNGKLFMYADDVILVVSDATTQIINDKLNIFMAELHNWLLKNKLILNVQKTKVMLVGSHQRIRTLGDPTLRVSVTGQTIECVSLFKCLGVTFDNNLTFKKHIENISLIIKQKLGIVRRLRNILSREHLKQLYWGYVLPHALYCCNTFSKRSQYNCEVLSKLHKRAAYIISRHSWETPSQQVFNELKWPSLKELLDRAMACLVFKCIHNVSALNVTNGFVFLDEVSQRNTRSSNKRLLKSYRCSTDFYQNTFVIAGIQLWNNLTLCARCSGSIMEFKREIKKI